MSDKNTSIINPLILIAAGVGLLLLSSAGTAGCAYLQRERKVRQALLLSDIGTMNDDIACGIDMRYFSPHGIREAPDFLHAAFANDQFPRHDWPLFDEDLFFAYGNPDCFVRGQFN